MSALKRSAQYWAKRFDQLTDAQLNKGADFYRNIAEQYEKAAAAVQKDIESWYMRFARNQAITLTEAKRLLNTRELKEFKWTVEEYIEKGKTLNYSKAWAKQLENASARFHVSRLEALQLQMQQQAELLYGYELDGLDALARKIYTEGYYHTAHIIQTGVGVGWDFMRLNTNLIDKVISKPWAADGADFSARLWKSRSQLVAALKDSLVQSIIRGQSPAQTIDLIRGKFKTSRAQAGRLVMTESAYFSSAAQHDSFKALDVERYQIVATLDRLTSEICRSLDGKVLPMSEYSPGSTAPPFHPFCRTTTVPYFEDDIGERAARDEEGNYYTVPSNMTYKEWEKTFVDGGDKKDLAKIEKIPLENSENRDIITLQGFNTTADPMREVTGAGLKSHPEETKRIVKELEAAGAEIEYRDNAMCYQPSLSPGRSGRFVIDPEASYSAWRHEETHFLDDKEDGYPGFRIFQDTERCIQREVRAYDVEIELANEAGRPDIAERLEELKRKEVARYYANNATED